MTQKFPSISFDFFSRLKQAAFHSVLLSRKGPFCQWWCWKEDQRVGTRRQIGKPQDLALTVL